MSVGKMTGPKKAAILLLALGEDAAADVMKNLEEAEIQQVGYYMSRFTDVSPEELDLVLEEFYRNSVMADEGVNISSSPDFVKNALTKALGADRAKELSDNLRAGEEEAGLEALRYAEPIMISNYIRSDHDALGVAGALKAGVIQHHIVPLEAQRSLAVVGHQLGIAVENAENFRIAAQERDGGGRDHRVGPRRWPAGKQDGDTAKFVLRQ